MSFRGSFRETQPAVSARSEFLGSLGDLPIIAACEFDDLDLAVDSPAAGVLLAGVGVRQLIDSSFAEITRRKPIILLLDFVRGLADDAEATELIARYAAPAAIATTRPSVIRAAQRLGIPTVQRVFLIDTPSMHKSVASIRENKPNACQLLPGVAPSVIPLVRATVDLPVFVGGLIHTGRAIDEAFAAGAAAVSTGARELWSYVPHGRFTSK